MNPSKEPLLNDSYQSSIDFANNKRYGKNSREFYMDINQTIDPSTVY